MYLLGKAFSEIDWNTLERAKAEKTEESRTLEFKRDLTNLEKEKSKRDFLQDVCAFANLYGGLLLYGVDEARSANSKLRHIQSLPGVGDTIPTDFKTRIEDLVRSSFDPRFAGVILDWIPSTDGKKRVLKVGVERSPLAPHRVTSNGSREFMLRLMASSQEMDAEQIREAVRRSIDASASATSRLEELAGKAATSRRDNHVTLWGCAVPAFQMALPQPIGSPVVSAALRKLQDTHPYQSGFRVRYDHLGIKLTAEMNPTTILERLHRDGAVERFDFVGTVQPPGQEGRKWIKHDWLADALAELGRGILGFRQEIGVGGPMIVDVGLFGAAGSLLQQLTAPTENGSVRGIREQPPPIVANAILLGPTDITDEFFGRIIKSAADLFWNAGGHPFCGGFTEDGTRTAGVV